MAVKVLLADEKPLMLAGLRRVLDSAHGIEVVAEAHSGAQVLPLIGRTHPDVILLDPRLRGSDGIACLELVRRRYPRGKVLVFGESDDPVQIGLALRRGADGYVAKSVNPLDLPSALRGAVEGTVFHAVGEPDNQDAAFARAAGLTDREIAILKGVARGLSNQAIAKELSVTEQTVKFHLTNIYRKLGVFNRTEAARYAYEQALIERPLQESA